MDNKAIKNRKNMINKGRLEFEKVLDRNLRTRKVAIYEFNLKFSFKWGYDQVYLVLN